IINATVKVKAKSEKVEEVAINGQKPWLLKITTRPLEVAEATLPGSTFWFDKSYEMIKSETIMPGLGKLVVERATREDALKPCVGPDLGWQQSISLKQRLTMPHDAAGVTYKLKLKDKDPEKVFTRDDRQAVKLVGEGV